MENSNFSSSKRENQLKRKKGTRFSWFLGFKGGGNGRMKNKFPLRIGR